MKTTTFYGPAPLWCQYASQSQPQRAHISIDTERGVLDAGYNYEVGPGGAGAVSFRVHHGIERRYTIPSNITSEDLNYFLGSATVQGLARRIIAGATTVWDGANMVSKQDSDADDAEELLIAHAKSTFDHYCGGTEVWDVENWLYDDARDRITAGMSDANIAAMAEQYENDAESEGILLEGDVYAYLISVRKDVREQ